MPRLEFAGESFYIYAMELFSKAGHDVASNPEFINHSPEQFIYFDNNFDVSLSRDQRALFKEFNNISRLFSINDCAFFSLNLLTDNRSQIAHDIHTMIHPLIRMEGSVCLFRHGDEVMLSFMGFGYHCILSDWYLMEDDYDQLSEQLDAANMTIERSADYFADMIYSLARKYYLYGQPSTYEMIPINFIYSAEMDGIDQNELDRLIQYGLAAPQREYGDDYIEYDESIVVRRTDFSRELDLMLLEMDDENDNPFGEDIEPDDIDDEFFDEDADGEEWDEYEFDNVDPEIFRDPILMVKWLDANE